MEDVPEPKIGDSDVLIKVRKASICGTDINIYKWDQWAAGRIPVPLTIGHEFVGEVVDFGRNVTDFKIGERVCGEGHLWCGRCRNCLTDKKHLCFNIVGIGVDRNGCFAEYLSLPAQNVVRLPDSIPDEIAAFADPLGNAVHTALSFDVVGEDVLITGAGPIGIMAAAICRHIGARNVVITDINDYRLDLARKMGIAHAINILKTDIKETIRELKIDDGFTVGLEMSGAVEAFRMMIDLMHNAGNIALLGILPDAEISWPKIIFKGLTLKGVYGREVFSTWLKMIRLLESGLDLTPIITHHYKFNEFEKGFAAMQTGQSGKVILDIS